MIASALDSPLLAYGTALLVGVTFIYLAVTGRLLRGVALLVIFEVFCFTMRYWLPMLTS